MNSLVCTSPGFLEYREMKSPELTPGHAIIKIRNICICGTDLHAFEGTQPFLDYPRILGHELSGELVACEGATGFMPGEKVTFIPYFSCGHCIACRMGKPNCCVSIQVCGVHVDGGMLEYLSVPAASLVHGRGLGYAELAMVEPLAIGAHGIRRAAIKPGEFVLVMGAGPIGLGAMEFARMAGAEVICMDLNHFRLEFCRNVLQFRHTVHALDPQVKEQILEITHGDMPTVVIDATGNQKAINDGLYYLAHGGRYVLIGLQKANLVFSHPEFHKRESTLMSSRNATRQDFEQVLASLESGLIHPLSYITDQVSFNRAAERFGYWLDPANAVIKAMIEVS